jgi:hypothetical protein
MKPLPHTYTAPQLKQALAKMLPEKIRATPSGFHLWWSFNTPENNLPVSRLVLDSELLHLCWLVEDDLSQKHQVDYIKQLWIVCNGTLPKVGHVGYLMNYLHATWQQRVIALAKVKNMVNL